ncbi:MAG: P-loop NTPase fold protein [bacterium]|nr:P-loop NTPase fold protein [bacterium]
MDKGTGIDINKSETISSVEESNPPYTIETPERFVDFDNHLKLSNNKRIVFSSRFGNGKTTFLKKFFKEHNKYNAIHLYPVNYSVASNEDIFELVKYDILFELLTKKIEIDDSVKSFLKIAKKLLISNKSEIAKIITPFFNIIPEIGGAVKESAERTIDFIAKVKDEFKEERNNEYDKIVDFLSEFTNKSGSIYEENFYTLLIKELVERLKRLNVNENEVSETVLVIDDMDRIDPEHIFRILNVFAAHSDINKNENKFGFDKVIVVCDIDNIRSIFHHKYGSKSDFNGYIDKFYSVDVFKYSMKDELLKEARKILDSIKGTFISKHFPIRSDLCFEVEWILSNFIYNGLINVRNVTKLNENDVIINEYQVKKTTDYNYNFNYIGLRVFNFLKLFFGNYEDLEGAFEKFVDQVDIFEDNSNYNIWRLEYIFLPIIGVYTSAEIKSIDTGIPILSHPGSIMIPYKLERVGGVNRDKTVCARFENKVLYDKIDVKKLYLETIQSARMKGLLK